MAMAQVKETPLQITVVANSPNISVFPADNYLFMESKNRIKVRISNGEISKVTFAGGTISGADSIYIVEVSTGGKALLSVYEKTSTGREKLAFNKEYLIVPYPQANFNGVRNDSLIDKLSLMGGFLKANNSLGYGIKIISFKMLIEKEGKFMMDSIDGNRLSKEMRMYVNRLRNGSVALIEEIKYVDPYGAEQIIPALRLFVVEPEKPIMFGM